MSTIQRTLVTTLCFAGVVAGSLLATPQPLPYRQAGLSEEQAAAHLLDRFAFGARPGEVERVVAMGLDTWLEQQLGATLPETSLDARLARFDTLTMSDAEIGKAFPGPGALLRIARRNGDGAMTDPPDPTDRREIFRALREAGYRDPRELIEQLLSQKVLRAVYAENQLAEVLTDFWFNHFNVSLHDNQARSHILAYERDAIRPNVLGDFGALLEATAQHPAMLYYLDNAMSRAEEGQRTAVDGLRGPRGPGRNNRGFGNRGSGNRRFGNAGRGGFVGPAQAGRAPANGQARNRPTGLNENYARELLELHTLGVDAGYTQQDVIEVARAFTGWTALPPQLMDQDAQRIRFAQRMGVVTTGENGFVFNAAFHDAEKKVVLGHTLLAGRGIEDGRQVLAILEQHPSTAQRIASKLAIRFVSDQPPASLVQAMAQTFSKTHGDIRAVLETMVGRPEFWSEEARRAKIKSPFELAVSAVRALDADIVDARPLAHLIGEMGEPLYAYDAPTGYPDRASQWVSSGALLQRMNFGLELASNQIPGVSVAVAQLLGDREPESAQAALRILGALLLPQRDLTATLGHVEPLLGSPQLMERVNTATQGAADAQTDVREQGADTMTASATFGADRGRFAGRQGRGRLARALPPAGPADHSPVAQIAGLLLGSPEFQRR